LNTILTQVAWAVPADLSVMPWGSDRIYPVLPGAGGSYVVSLNDGRIDAAWEPPLTVIVYRGGMILDSGSSGSGFNATGNAGNGTLAADTDAASPGGMPWQEESKLTNFVSNFEDIDGVSHDAPMLPTPVLTALAASGRNPADIMISIMTGGEGSGGGDDEDVETGGSSGAVSAAGEAAPAGGGSGGKSHEVGMAAPKEQTGVGHHYVPRAVAYSPKNMARLSPRAQQLAMGTYSGPTNPKHRWGEGHPEYNARVDQELDQFIEMSGGSLNEDQLEEFQKMVRQGRGANGAPDEILMR
jgi:hypothetical protein